MLSASLERRLPVSPPRPGKVRLFGLDTPAPIVERRLDGRLIVAAPGKRNRWLILDQAPVPAVLAKRIKAPAKVVVERIVVPVEMTDAMVAMVDGYITGGAMADDHDSRLGDGLDCFEPFLDLLLRGEHGADDEVHRLGGPDAVEGRAQGPAFPGDCVAGGAGEFGTVVNRGSVHRVPGGANFRGELVGERLGERPARRRHPGDRSEHAGERR